MLDLTDWQNKKFTNKNGTEAVILTIDAPGPQPIVGYLKYSTSDVDGITVCAWHRDGHFHTAEMSGMDLVNVKTNREGWVNVYPDEVYETLEDAKACSGPHCVLNKHVEWEE